MTELSFAVNNHFSLISFSLSHICSNEEKTRFNQITFPHSLDLFHTQWPSHTNIWSTFWTSTPALLATMESLLLTANKHFHSTSIFDNFINSPDFNAHSTGWQKVHSLQHGVRGGIIMNEGYLSTLKILIPFI